MIDFIIIIIFSPLDDRSITTKSAYSFEQSLTVRAIGRLSYSRQYYGDHSQPGGLHFFDGKVFDGRSLRREKSSSIIRTLRASSFDFFFFLRQVNRVEPMVFWAFSLRLRFFASSQRFEFLEPPLTSLFRRFTFDRPFSFFFFLSYPRTISPGFIKSSVRRIEP